MTKNQTNIRTLLYVYYVDLQENNVEKYDAVVSDTDDLFSIPVVAKLSQRQIFVI